MSHYQKMLDEWKNGARALAPITELLGIEPIDLGEGEARVGMRADARHHNAIGSVHGGIFGDLADVAMGVALASLLQNGEGFATLNLQIDYLLAVREDDLIAHAQVIQRSRTTAFLRCQITRESDGELVAEVTSRCMLFLPQP